MGGRRRRGGGVAKLCFDAVSKDRVAVHLLQLHEASFPSATVSTTPETGLGVKW